MASSEPIREPGPGQTATIDPDEAWTVGNQDYSSTSWYSSKDGNFERRIAKESPLDSFSGLNYNKIAVGANEYYGRHEAPLFKYEYDEDEYYKNLEVTKTDEEVQAELNEPVEKMEAKLQEFLDKGIIIYIYIYISIYYISSQNRIIMYIYPCTIFKVKKYYGLQH